MDVSLQLHPSMSQTQTCACAWTVTAHGERRMQLQSSTACARIGNQAAPSRSRTSKLYAQQTIPDCLATGIMTSVLKEVSHEAQQRTGCGHARPSATDDQCSDHVVISVLKEANHKNPKPWLKTRRIGRMGLHIQQKISNHTRRVSAQRKNCSTIYDTVSEMDSSLQQVPWQAQEAAAVIRQCRRPKHR